MLACRLDCGCEHLRLAVGLFAFVLLCLTSAAVAQPKPGYDPSSTHIFPAGGRRGTKVAVRVGTECAPPLTRFHFSADGLTAPRLLEEYASFVGEPSPRRLPTEIPITYPREWKSTVDISPDAPLGAAFWRLSSGQGGTGSRPFMVGDLPELIERESNSVADKAEAITLPITLNGQICGERDVDYYRLAAKAGEVISCEMIARRLGSVLDPVVQLLDSAGNSLQVDQALRGDDPIVVLRVPHDGDYLLRIANVTSNGSPACVYRIQLTKKPFLLSMFPAGGQAGTQRELEVHALDGTGTVRVTRAQVSLPKDVGDRWEYRDQQLASSVWLQVDAHSSTLEQEANDSLNQAQALSIPQTVDGRLSRQDDQDCFSFAAIAKQQYSILCRATRPASDCLPTISLFNAAGKQLAAASSVEAPDGVCRITWKAPADGTFAVRVRDLRYGATGGPAFTYRLSVGTARQDFQLRLSADNINITQGGESNLSVEAARLGGFAGPIALKVEGLPAGVTIEGAAIPAKKTTVKLKLKVSADVPARSWPLRLVGQAEVNGQAIKRIALAKHLGVDSEGTSAGPAALDRFQMAVRHKPIFRLYCAEAYQYAHRGTVYPYGMEIERLDGFDGPIVVQTGDRQNRDMDGIEFLTTSVLPTKTEFMMPIYLPETMHINVQSQSQLYTQAYAIFEDKHGDRQSVLVLSEKRNMIRTLPPVVKLKAVQDEIKARRGEIVTCRLALERTSNFLGPMEVTLLDSSATPCTAEPITIPARATEAQIALALETSMPAQSFTARFRAVGELSPGTQVISETQVLLDVKDE